jgi:hypothetical protein
MLHQHSQWQAEVGDRITNIQQHQQQENENWNYLFQKLNFDPLLVFLNANRKNPQAHGITIVAFT